MSLSGKQIRNLRAEAHRLKLKPVVMVGQNGLSENVVNEMEQALDHHELLKVRIPAGDKASKQEMIATLCTRLDATEVQAIGHVVVLFRQNPRSTRFVKLLKQSN